MKKVLLLANSDSAIYKFRGELINALSQEYKIGVGIPFGDYMSEIRDEKLEFFDVRINRHGVNPLEDLKLIKRYKSIVKSFRPDAVLTYTIKPNLYASYVCARQGIPYLCNITGLGVAEKPGKLQSLLVGMYRFAMKKADTIFFQNEHGIEFFRRRRIGVESQYRLLPGSGVNLTRFSALEYPQESDARFLFVARVIKEKGIDEFLAVAKRFHQEKLAAEFYICGACEENYRDEIEKLARSGVVVYRGLVKDMRQEYARASCVVLPSYYPEGQSNVLLEGAASARPLITTDWPGCREAVDDGITGFLVAPKDADGLYEKAKRFYELDVARRKQMGLLGRQKMENVFDRNIVVRAYQERLRRLKL